MRAWAIGSAGSGSLILTTVDGGQTWNEQSLPPDMAAMDTGFVILNGVTFIDESEGWVVGELFIPSTSDAPMPSPLILHTIDGGTSWTLQNVPTDVGILDAVTFLDTKTGWAVGSKEGQHLLDSATLILHTDDGGNTWRELPSPSRGSLRAIAFPSFSDGWAIGISGPRLTGLAVSSFILHSADGGMTWVRQDLPPPVNSSEFFSDLAFPTSREGWVVGHPVLHTSDGGATWVDQTPTVLGDILGSVDAVTFPSPSQGWAVGIQSASDRTFGAVPLILHTADGGTTWSQQVSPPGFEGALNEVSFANPVEGWAIGAKVVPEELPLPVALRGTPSTTTPVLVAIFCVPDVTTAGVSIVADLGLVVLVLPATVELITLSSGTQQLTFTITEGAHVSLGTPDLVQDFPVLSGVTLTGILSDCNAEGLCTFATVGRAGTRLGPDINVALATGFGTCSRPILDKDVTGTVNLRTGEAELFLDLTVLVTNVPCPAEGEPVFIDGLDLMIPLTTGESRLEGGCPGGLAVHVPFPLILHTTDGGNTWVDQSENIQGEREALFLTAVATAPAQ